MDFKRNQSFWKGLVVAFALGGAACDGMALDDGGVAVERGALRGSPTTTVADDVIVDGRIITAENPAAPTRKRPTGYITTSGGGEVIVFNDLTVGDGPFVRDCSAKATDCNAECSVVGQGSCDSGGNYVTCSLTYPCGDNTCTTTQEVHCSE